MAGFSLSTPPYIKYSTTSHIVGEMPDGKPIYEKTIITKATILATTSDIGQIIDNTMSNYLLIDYDGVMTGVIDGSKKGNAVPMFYNSTNYVYIRQLNSNDHAITCVMYGSHYLNRTIIATIRFIPRS